VSVSPVLVFGVAAGVLVVSRRVSVWDGLILVVFGMLIAGTQVADVVAYPFAWVWSHV
jgi:hypothetical protein